MVSTMREKTSQTEKTLCVFFLYITRSHNPKGVLSIAAVSMKKESSTFNITVLEDTTHNPICFQRPTSKTPGYHLPGKTELNGAQYFRNNFKNTFR